MVREFDVLAHKTCCGNAPPNSKQGLLMAWYYGARFVECDITFSRNGEPFVWSNDMNHLICGVSLERLTSAEISRMRRADCGAKIMRAEDIFEFLIHFSEISAVFDVKYYKWDVAGHLRAIPGAFIDLALRKIVEPADRAGLLPRIGFVVFGGGLELLRATRIAAPHVPTNLIIVSPKWSIGDLDNKNLVCPRSLIVGWKLVNYWKLFPRHVARISHEAKVNGLRIYAGLADGKKDLRWIWSMGFDGAWVDDVIMAKEFLEEKGIYL